MEATNCTVTKTNDRTSTSAFFQFNNQFEICSIFGPNGCSRRYVKLCKVEDMIWSNMSKREIIFERGQMPTLNP